MKQMQGYPRSQVGLGVAIWESEYVSEMCVWFLYIAQKEKKNVFEILMENNFQP